MGIDASLNSIHNVQVTIIFSYSLRHRIQSFHYSNTPLELSDEIANVLLKAFKNKLSLDRFVPRSEVNIPTGWSRQLAVDCEHLSYVLAIAYCNHSMFLFLIPLFQLLTMIKLDYLGKQRNMQRNSVPGPPDSIPLWKICSSKNFHRWHLHLSQKSQCHLHWSIPTALYWPGSYQVHSRLPDR